MHCALAEPRSGPRIHTCLVALGLATHGVAAWAGPFPPELELSSLLPANGGDGSTGFVLNGIDVGDQSGSSVSNAGDVNGDDLDDLLIGADNAAPGGRVLAGESYIVFGRDPTAGGFPGEFELSSLLPANGGDGSAGFILNGINATDGSGYSVSAAGDINGDGIDDLLIGTQNAAPDGLIRAGESYVVFGRNQAAGGFPAEFELSSLLPANGGDGSAGFILNGIDGGDHSGASVSGAGDVNGDGIDDLLIGADYADPGGREFAGESYIVFGRNQTAGGFPAEFELSSLLPANGGDGSAGVILNGVDSGDRSGRSVSGAGDINGDGIDDLLIGVYYADTDGRSDGGESYVVFGRDQAAGGFPVEFELSSLLPANGGDGSAGFVLRSIDQGDFHPFVTVSEAGDVNDDGIDDLLIGALGADPGGRSTAGESYVVFGRDTTAVGFPAEFELSSLLPANGGDGSAGFILNGIDIDDLSGTSVSAAGDVNGDGIDDLLIGATGADPGGRELAGESYIVFGRNQAAGGFPAEFELSSLLPGNGGDGNAGFILNGIDAQDFAGTVSAAGDINGDGIHDVLVGADGADPDGRYRAGESYVVFGRTEGAGLQCEGLDATIIGTQDGDEISGTEGPDVINALDGNDTILGLGGDDIVCGGEGDDVMYGSGGHDSLFGQAGNDTLIGAGGGDFLVGAQGNDDLQGGGGNDQLFGDEGDDTLSGGGGNDAADGGPDTDICDGGGNSDTGANCETSNNIP
jgi:hypothetical protein